MGVQFSYVGASCARILVDSISDLSLRSMATGSRKGFSPGRSFVPKPLKNLGLQTSLTRPQPGFLECEQDSFLERMASLLPSSAS